jgi:pyridoxamine 5'-phosphate oxidase
MRVLDNRGLVFYTNLGSRKSREIAANRRVAAAFTWIPLRRQVRIEGAAWPVADEEADAYFATRPLDARLGAHASPQSAVIPDRAWLVESLVAAAERFGDGEVPRPADWGGYRVVPDSFEFWQGRAGRLHDRVRYRPGAAGWIVERLAP